MKTKSDATTAVEKLRRWPRATLHLPVQFTVKSVGIGSGLIEDISEGGLRLSFDTKIKTGEEILIHLVLVPGLDALILQGRLVWRAEMLYGIELTNLSALARTVLRNTVNFHLHLAA